MNMSDQQYDDIVEHATRTIIGNSQEISVAEMKQVVWLVAVIMTGVRTESGEQS